MQCVSRVWLTIVLFSVVNSGIAQSIFYPDKIYSPYTLDDDKAVARRDKIIQQANMLATIPLAGDDSTEEVIQSSLWSISQFLVNTPKSTQGIKRLATGFNSLGLGTQRALLEVIYGIYPKEFYTEMLGWMQDATDAKSFAMEAAYVYRAYPTDAGKRAITQKATSFNTGESQSLMIYNLLKYIDTWDQPSALPDIDSLFAWQQVHKFKVVYSFQSKNRDIPGIAIVQNPDGSFVKDDAGKPKMFNQLARSASDLPWFITNGSTPQGLYSITGYAISRNPFIGPTPNLQMVMMNEVNPPVFTHYFPPVFNAPPEKLYRSYLPENWQQWSGLMEAYDAGKIGRSEIIAHGSTVDPEWYAGKPYYPLTPTMGCLCGKEIWNKQNGKIVKSDQLDLVNAFIETAGKQGYLFVINVDDKEVSLDPVKIAAVVAHFEANRKMPAPIPEQASN